LIKKPELADDDMEEFNLINECNVYERKGSTSIEKEASSTKSLHGLELPFITQQLPYLPMVRGQYSDYRMIQS
jgi:hypothetical protein